MMNNRITLYRAKSHYYRNWLYGYMIGEYTSNVILVSTGTKKLVYWIFEPDLQKCVEIISDTIGRYFGIEDKNGRKIFEDDIVSGLFLYSNPVIGICAFKDGSFGLKWFRGEVEEFSPFPCMCNVSYEVLGNIHDNPELLKGEEDDTD